MAPDKDNEPMTKSHDVAEISARLARAYPRLSAYSAAWLAVRLDQIERAQRRHAERCCNGEDGGYVRVRPMVGMGDRATMVREHDPDAEARAGERIETRARMWAADCALRSGCAALDWPKVDLHSDPRGRVLVAQFPGEAAQP